MEKDLIKQRNEAILSLDREKILAYAEEHQIKMPDDYYQFWAGIHKARLHIDEATEAQKAKSFAWLVSHGFNPIIKFNEV